MKIVDKNDIIGNRYGMITVVEYAGIINNKSYYKCMCDCGKEHLASRQHLRFGDVKSCGCNRYGHGRRTHGMTNSKIFKVWQGIKKRCTNKNDPCYQKYGAKGIEICPEWEHDFMAFYNWAMENGYKEGLTIDRKDYRGNYCPENCRWVDLYEQANNKSNNIRITIDGVEKTLPQWCREYNVPYKKIYRYLYKRKMSFLDAVNEYHKKQH